MSKLNLSVAIGDYQGYERTLERVTLGGIPPH